MSGISLAVGGCAARRPAEAQRAKLRHIAGVAV